MSYYQIKDLYPHLINPQKFVGKRPITCRSGWEISYITKFLDKHPSVLEWSSEDIIIPYIKPTDQRIHRYFVDIYMKIKTTMGIKEVIVEIKPSIETKAPALPKRMTAGYKNRVITWLVNSAKWEAAKAWCLAEQKKGRDISFTLETELTTNIFK